MGGVKNKMKKEKNARAFFSSRTGFLESTKYSFEYFQWNNREENRGPFTFVKNN